jgi:hypothetical protein
MRPAAGSWKQVAIGAACLGTMLQASRNYSNQARGFEHVLHAGPGLDSNVVQWEGTQCHGVTPHIAGPEEKFCTRNLCPPTLYYCLLVIINIVSYRCIE